jgi:Ca2+-binding RTX toxin-like protein
MTMTRPFFRTAAAVSAITAVIGAAPVAALAQTWEPAKPIEFVVPAGTGGGADQMARFIQGVVAKNKLMKQPIIVVNKSGGAGADVFRFIQFEAGSDVVTDFNVTQGDKLDLRGLLQDTGFQLADLSLFVRIDAGVNETRVKVDTLGTGNFSAPSMTISLLSPQGINDGCRIID